jgi:hypothetical protein
MISTRTVNVYFACAARSPFVSRSMIDSSVSPSRCFMTKK